MAGQTPAQLLRDMEARNAAIRRYAAAHDRFAIYEQETRTTMAAPCDSAGSELDDPEPKA